MGVEYNTALSNMANEQTLLNIIRAKEGMPAHYTSVSRFTGTLSVNASSSIGGQLKGEGKSNTIVSGNNSPTVTDAAGNITTVTPGATSSVTELVTEGVDLYSPSVAGQLTTGTVFDVAIFDTQKFYQGITAALPFSTVENYINQGFDRELLMYLLVARVDFRAKESSSQYSKGESVRQISNDPSKPNKFKTEFVDCYTLLGKDSQRDPVKVAAMSRFTKDAAGDTIPLAFDKIGVIDGEKYKISNNAALEGDAANDDSIYLMRVSAKSRVPQLLLETNVPACLGGFTKSNEDISSFSFDSTKPPAQPVYLGEGKMLVAELPKNGNSAAAANAREIDVDLEITFRSTEAIVRYLGDYLRNNTLSEGDMGGALFSVKKGRTPDAKISARLNGKNYSLVNQGTSVRNMLVISLVQQLVNLQKESSDRPLTIPIRALP